MHHPSIFGRECCALFLYQSLAPVADSTAAVDLPVHTEIPSTHLSLTVSVKGSYTLMCMPFTWKKASVQFGAHFAQDPTCVHMYKIKSQMLAEYKCWPVQSQPSSSKYVYGFADARLRFRFILVMFITTNTDRYDLRAGSCTGLIASPAIKY